MNFKFHTGLSPDQEIQGNSGNFMFSQGKSVEIVDFALTMIHISIQYLQ